MEDLLISSYFVDTYHAVAYILMAFFIFYVGKWVYQRFHLSINIQTELVIKDNLAFGVAHAGYFMGVLASVGGLIVGESNGLAADLLDMFVYGLLSILLLNLSTLINEKVILRRFSVEKEICEDQNVGTGIIEAASALGSGLIIFGAVSGEGTAPLYALFVGDWAIVSFSPFMGLLTTIVYWAIGMILLVLTARFYNYILPYDALVEIEKKDNVAVGVGFAGALVAISILVSHALQGDFAGWIYTAQELAFEMGIGLVLLPGARLLTDKILLPGKNLTDELVNQERANIGAGIIEAFSYIGGAILITWCI